MFNTLFSIKRAVLKLVEFAIFVVLKLLLR